MLAYDCSTSADGLIMTEKRNPLEFYYRENAFIRFINLPLVDAIVILLIKTASD